MKTHNERFKRSVISFNFLIFQYFFKEHVTYEYKNFKYEGKSNTNRILFKKKYEKYLLKNKR